MRLFPRSVAMRGACLLAAATPVVATLAIVDPAAAEWMPPCLWRSLTGLLCPGCGSARAAHALLQGDLIAALHFNPLAVATLPFATVDLANRVRGRRPGAPGAFPASGGYLLLSLLVLYGIARNLPLI
jgi:Protein of unknown function (DUF2752)